MVVNPILVVPRFLTGAECLDVIAAGNAKPAKKEEFGEDEGRYSHVSEFTPCMFLDAERDYKKRIHERLFSLNRRHFGYALNEKKWLHGNFLRYEKGGFTGWHYDGYFGKEYADRKLSAVIMLSESDEYVGGNFQLPFYMQPQDKYEKMRQRGTLLLFPSFVFHQVTPVTKGTRYTLAYFLNGPKFK